MYTLVVLLFFRFSMYTFRIIFAFYMVLLLLPQTPKLNLLLRLFHSTEMFATYKEADQFLKGLTVVSVLIFLSANYFAAK